jgi:hypothetical protein
MLNDDNGMQELTIPVILLHETEYSPAHLGPRSVPYLGYGFIGMYPLPLYTVRLVPLLEVPLHLATHQRQTSRDKNH